jgi:hypothetical protein
LIEKINDIPLPDCKNILPGRMKKFQKRVRRLEISP